VFIEKGEEVVIYRVFTFFDENYNNPSKCLLAVYPYKNKCICKDGVVLIYFCNNIMLVYRQAVNHPERPGSLC